MKYQTSYLTYDPIMKTVMLRDIELKEHLPLDAKSKPKERYLWLLDTQPDGIFKMVSGAYKMVLQCDKDNRLFLDTSKSDSNQFWRKEGNFIVSDRSHGYLGVDDGDNKLLSVHCDASDENAKSKLQCEIKKVVSCLVS